MRVLIFLFAVQSLLAAEGIGGFWKTINEEGVAQAVIAIYEYEGLYYGRIVGSYKKGVMNDTIYTPIVRAPGVVGQPFYSGLDIIWYLQNRGIKFKGKILDPQKGHVYNSELWVENGNLIVRGKFMMFGRNQTWVAATPDDFPKDFKIPDLTTFVPVIPTPN